jgi:hypothetical protein
VQSPEFKHQYSLTPKKKAILLRLIYRINGITIEICAEKSVHVSGLKMLSFETLDCKVGPRLASGNLNLGGFLPP